jgi:hypothetical protein
MVRRERDNLFDSDNLGKLEGFLPLTIAENATEVVCDVKRTEV